MSVEVVVDVEYIKGFKRAVKSLTLASLDVIPLV